MVGKRVMVYCVVFTFVITLTIGSFSIPAFAAIEELKFDQTKIPFGHSSTITIIDSSAPHIISFEDFESGFTDWDNTSGDSNDCWTRSNDPQSPRTTKTGPQAPPPNNGAPSITHPSGTEWHAYYESSPSGCGAELDEAFLLGPTIDFDAFNNVQIKFWTHLYDGGGWFGDDMGVLSLHLEDLPLGTGVFKEVWSSAPPTGSQGNQWNQIPPIDLSALAPEGGQREIRFVATDTETGSQSDMAVDEIIIQGDIVDLPSTVISYEDFESGFTDWDNTSGDSNDCWTRSNDPQSPRTTKTGPQAPPPNNGAPSITHPSGTEWHAYYESSPSGCGAELDKAFLLYDTLIDFNAYSDIHIEFWTHLYDGGGWFGDDMGVLSLELENVTPCSPPGIPPCSPLGFINSGDRTFTEVWSSAPPTGSQGNQWNQIPPIDLSALAPEGGQREIRFVATDTETGSQSDIAVDEIIIRGVTNAYMVEVQAVDGTTGALLRDPINVPILKRDSNLYWQLVEFGGVPSNEANRHLHVNVGEKVRVTAVDGTISLEEPEILTDQDGTIPTLLSGLDYRNADCDDVALALGGDSDEDGICNAWEDIDPVNPRAPLVINYPEAVSPFVPYTMDPGPDDNNPGEVCDSFIQVDPANPVKCFGSDQRDIYVEINYMDGHKPNIEALHEVIESFANAPPAAPGKSAGIRLHIQLDSNEAKGPIGHQICTQFPGDNADHGYDQIKKVYFGTDEEHAKAPIGFWAKQQKAQIFHYGLFVHAQCNPQAPASTGVGEVAGNDFMVTLGFETGGIGNPDEQAGTFMHELGHNLNLHHGGEVSDETNCKPNHLSVMNYARQFPIFNADRALDFSRQALGANLSPGVSLNEDELRESQPNAIDIYDFNPNEGVVYGPIPPLFPPPTHSNINWDNDDDEAETSVPAMSVNEFTDIDGCDDTQTNENLMGYAEWDDGIMKLNTRFTHNTQQGWADGRSAAAGFDPAFWEDGATTGLILHSQTCPSVQQILDWADQTWLDKARDPADPDHELAKEKISGHLSNYRICEGGVGQPDPLKLKKVYLNSLLTSIPNILTYYGDNPEQAIDDILKKYDKKLEWYDIILQFFSDKEPDKIVGEILQPQYTVVDTILVRHGNTLDAKTTLGLTLIKEKLSIKANLFHVQLNQTSIEDVIKVEPIFTSAELTTDSIKKMRELRVDSMSQYLKNLNQSHFYEPKNNAIQYYETEFNQVKNYIQNSSYANAAMVMANLDHAGKIKNVITLEKLELATDTIVDQYTRAIPEFGTIASLILVASITCIIFLTTKTRNIFLPKKYQ